MAHAFESIVQGFVNDLVHHPNDRWYGFFGLNIVFKADPGCPTAGVYVKQGRMHMDYNPEWVANLSEAKLRFLYLHEIYHLISGHCGRIRAYGMEPDIGNIAADAIINETILKPGTVGDAVELPSQDLVRMDPDYKEEWILEPVYEFYKKQANQCPHCKEDMGDIGKALKDAIDNGAKPDKNGCYDVPCPHCGKNVKVRPKGVLDEHNLQKGNDTDEVAKSVVGNIVEGLKQAGHIKGEHQKLIDGLRKEPENILKHVRKAFRQAYGLSTPEHSRTREHLHHPELELPGKRKHANSLSVVCDTSGSMWNELQDVLSYLFRDGYEFNIVLCDTEVQATHKIKKKTDLKKITFKGGGGTILSGGIAYCESNWPKDFVLVLTDGYTDRLEFARPGNVVLSTGAAPDTNGNCKVFVRPRRS